MNACVSDSVINDAVDALRPFEPVVDTYLPETRDRRKVFGVNDHDLFLEDFRRARTLIAQHQAGQPPSLAELAAALRPFAAIANEYLEEFRDQRKVTAMNEVNLYLIDFRRARAQLNQIQALLPAPRAPRPA